MNAKSVITKFKENAREFPDHIAASHKNEKITYTELDLFSDNIAQIIFKNSNAEFPKVSVLMDRNSTLLASLLAIFKNRGVYIPLEPSYPTDRLQYMLSKSECQILLTDNHNLLKAENLCKNNPTLSLINIQAEKFDNANFKITKSEGNDIAYIIFTSGTTGQPKGVMIEQKSLSNHLQAKINDLSITPKDIIAQSASHCFDISMWQFLAALMVGGTTHIVEQETSGDSLKLVNLIRENKISVIQFVPSLLRSLLNSLEVIDNITLPSLRIISTVGEALAPDICHRWLNLYPKVPILNHYGPTECADGVTHCLISNPPSATDIFSPIGLPIGNTRIYIVEPDVIPLKLTKQGDIGELYVSGIGLARGYINDEEKTKNVFFKNPFCEENLYSRLYKTGDLARLRDDGMFECLGRTDRQVKLRGYRIELSEIEGVLAMYESVQSCAVIVHTPQSNKVKLTARETISHNTPEDALPRLIAFIQLSQDCKRSNLVEYVADNLPAYMIPDLFFAVDSLPLNTNGKLDYKKLPSPDNMRPLSDVKYLKPDPGPQSQLCTILSGILNLDRIGKNDNFLALGGDSLRAMLAINRIQRFFSCKLSIADLYSSTIDELTIKISQPKNILDVLPGIKPHNDDSLIAPVSHIQEHLWFLWKLDPSASNYTLQTVFECDGPLDIPLFNKAWNAMVNYFDTLRIKFSESNGTPSLTFDSPPNDTLRFIDISQYPKQIDSETDRLKKDEFYPPFNLLQGNLFRALMIKKSEKKHVIIFTTHEIIMDAWSLSVMVRKLQELYSFPDTININKRQTLTFADYTRWEKTYINRDALKSDKEFWAKELSGQLPVLSLPSDKARPRKITYIGKSRAVYLPGSLVENLRKLSADNRTTLFSTVLTAFYILLNKYSDQDDIIIGTPNVVRSHSGTEELLGFFLNMLPLRTKIDTTKSFSEHLVSVQNTVTEATTHTDFPFSWMLEDLELVRSSNLHPVFQVMFNMYSEKAELPKESNNKVSIFTREIENGFTKYDLTLYCQEEGNGLYLQMSYCTEVFTDEIIERMLLNLNQIINVSVQNPEIPLKALDFLDSAEKRFIKSFNKEPSPLSETKTFRTLFEQQAKDTPKKVAYFWGDNAITYEDLNASVDNFANKMLQAGIIPGNKIIIGKDRGIEAIIAILAAVKMHVTYVVIGHDYPQKRIKDIITDVVPDLFVYTENQLHIFNDTHVKQLSINEVSIHACKDQINQPIIPNEPHEILHITYTSGSTGKPKGVRINTKACLNRLTWMWNTFPFESNAVSVVHKSAALVASTWEIFGPLFQGIPTLILSQQESHDPSELLSLLEKYNVTHLLCSPPVLTGMITARQIGGPKASSLRFVTSGAEPLPAILAEKFKKTFPQVRLYNFYGASECSSNSGWGEVKENKDGIISIAIESPLTNVALTIVDKDGNLVPQGAVGEVRVTGICLASGYHNLPTHSSLSFIENTLDILQKFGPRSYNTGDLGRFRDNGSLELLGRKDNQIKIHGFRIELDEITHTALMYPGINEAVSHLHHDNNGEPHLVTYLVADDTSVPASTNQIKKFLSEFLIPHAVPRTIMFLNSLPKLPGGKLDRSSLPEPHNLAGRTVHTVPAITQTERILSNIWQDILQIESIGREDHFFSSGGTSMMSVRCVAQAAKQGIRFSVSDLYDNPILKQLGEIIDSRSGDITNECPDKYSDISEMLEITPTVSFMNQYMGFSEHYNLCGLWMDDCQLLDRNTLEKTISKLTYDYSVLRTRIETSSRGLIFTTNPSSINVQHIELDEFDSLDACQSKVSLITEETQHSFLFDGECPLFRVILMSGKIQGETHSWLFIVIHHFLVDGYGFRLLLDEIERYYLSLKTGTTVLPAFTGYGELQRWIKNLRRHVIATFDCELTYWKNKTWSLLADNRKLNEIQISIPDAPDTDSSRLIFDMLARNEDASPTFKTLSASKGVHYFKLSESTTTTFMKLHIENNGFDAFDVILSALADVVGNGSVKRGLFIDSLDMLRTPILPGYDLSTVLGFTAELIPLTLILDTQRELLSEFAAIRRQRNAAPIHGLGLRAATHLLPQELSEQMDSLPWPRAVINYRAPLNNLRARELLGLKEPNIWTGVAMGHNRHHKIRMNVDFVAGQLKFQVYLALDQYDITAAGILINKLYEKLEHYGEYLKEMDSKLGQSNTEKCGAARHE